MVISHPHLNVHFFLAARRKPGWSLSLRRGFVWIHLRSYQKVV